MDDTLLRVGDLPDEHFTKAFLNQNVSEQKEQIHEFTKILKEEESSESEVRNTVIKFRRIFSSEPLPPIDEAIATGAVPLLVGFLKHKEILLQYESAWALCSLASGPNEHTVAVTESGAIDIFSDLLSGDCHVTVVEQVLEAIGNIAGNSRTERDLILLKVDDIFEKFVQLLHKFDSLHSIKRNVVWVTSNLVRGLPQVIHQHRMAALRLLSRFLTDPDPEVRTDVCWGLSYLSNEPVGQIQTHHIQTVLDTIDISQLILFLTQNDSTLKPALQCLGTLVSGTDVQTQTVLASGFLAAVSEVLQTCQQNDCLKECCWGLSNVAAGSRAQIQEMIDSGVLNYFDSMIQRREENITKEMLWVLSNMASKATVKQLNQIFLEYPPFLDFLLSSVEEDDPRVVSIALEGLTYIFITAKKSLPHPHSFAIQLSQSEIDPLGALKDLKSRSILVGNEQLRVVMLLELLEEALADITFIKPAKN